MNNTDLSRFSKKVVSYFWDPLPKNECPDQIWCLGRSYDSRYQEARQAKSAGTSPSAHSDDSAVVIQSKHEDADYDKLAQTVPDLKSVTDHSSSDEEALGWPSEFLDDLESRPWLTYRSGFPSIPKASDPAASSSMSFSTKLRNLGSQGGFTADTGWGCMIRSGQTILANTLADLKLGRDWRKGQQEQEHKDLLALFADSPEAPFSIHKFVEHGAHACGKHPGEWFGPSATARCIQALTDKHSAAGLRVYVRPDDSDVYADSVLATATAKDADDKWQPTLILLGIRLGIDRITPVYHAALKSALEMPQSIGIAGGRPSSSHYFIGHQGDSFFYLDPHSTRPALPQQLSTEDIETCHTRRVRRLGIAEMDPSMLLGFLIRSKEDFEEWKKAVSETEGKAIIHVHDKEPKYATGTERPEAVDEVEAWDETGDEA